MGSRGLLRLTATRWGPGPSCTAPCLTSQPPQRLASKAQSTSTYRHYGLYNHPRSLIWPENHTSRTSPRPALPATPTRPSTSRSKSTTTKQPKPPLSPRRRRIYILIALAIALHIAYRIYTSTSSSKNSRATLNKSLFTPCTVLANEPLSPSAFLLTIQLPPGASSHNNKAIVAAAHAYGLWSVEVKQPQLQIARNYTPLPPPPSHPSTANDDGHQQQQLQFYVRRYAGGEVSSYLSRLAPGDNIEIRGPHLGFDLAQRLGSTNTSTPGTRSSRRKVVFLAGGTSVASAMQAAAALLLRADDDDAVDVDVLWANRGAADCAGFARVGGGAGEAAKGRWRWWWGPGSTNRVTGEEGEEEPSAVVRQLRALQDAYAARGRTLDVRCAVDAEGSVLGAREIEDAVVWRRVAVPPSSPSKEGSAPAASASCHFHSQRLLEYFTEESDAAGTEDAKTASAGAKGKKKCTCVGDGDRGKNLFMVSGPDGFVSAFAGPKVWADGGERQGPVGGVVAELRRKDPESWKNWLVLKQ